ncbi:MAG: 4'-phosphopantetheinyl transferase superfamily protein [Pseudaminobacter sp.]
MHAHTVDVWCWDLDRPEGELAGLRPLLSQDEQDRAARFVFERDSNRYIAGRAILRRILGRYLAREAAGLRFCYNEFGKPRLADASSLHFNLSHAGGVAALAISDRHEIGIDAEEKKPLKEDIARRFFSAAEYGALRGLSGQDYVEAFFRCWTRKEAFVKAHGAGLSLDLASFDVSLLEGEAPRLLRLGDDATASAQWRLANVHVRPHLAGALAAFTGGAEIVLRYCDLHDMAESYPEIAGP